MERDPMVEGVMQAVGEIAHLEALQREVNLWREFEREVVRRSFTPATRFERYTVEDGDEMGVIFKTGTWETRGRILWIGHDTTLLEAVAWCALRTAQQHMLELAHRRGGYS